MWVGYIRFMADQIGGTRVIVSERAETRIRANELSQKIKGAQRLVPKSPGSLFFLV